MQSPVFISYSSKDVNLANKIVEYLEGQGYPCWIAPRNITSGHDYTDMINDAILHCRAVVLIVSARAVQSQWVKKELSTAVSYDKPILPYRISNVEITGGLQFLLNNVQWIDASSNPTGHFSDLVDGLEQRLSAGGVSTGSGKRHKAPLFVGLSVAAVALATGGYFLLRGSFAEPSPVDTSYQLSDTAVRLPVVDTFSVEKVAPVSKVGEGKTKTEVRKQETVSRKAENVSQKQETASKPPVEESAPKVESTAQPEVEITPVVTVPDTAGQAQARRAAAKEQAFQKKLRMAKGLYIDHSYREALNLFEELHREKPFDREINAYIKDCRKNL